MRVGDRIRVEALWSEFWGYDGVVVAVDPHVMVLLDGDSFPIRIDAVSLARHPDEAVAP